MTSSFTNIFRKSDDDELRSFQASVAEILRERYPDKEITTADDPHTVIVDGQRCGLTNVHSNVLLLSKGGADLREIVLDHFDILFRDHEAIGQVRPDWESVKSMLMPQLMPREFLEKVDLVHFPFGDEIILGFVVDRDSSYRYVSQNDQRAWNVDEDEIRRIAIEILESRSTGIEATAIPGESGFVILGGRDGFDAVRVISPGIQDFVAEVIKRPFFFGVPNRDFLICWSATCDKETDERFRAQIIIDSREQAYPLSPSTFEVTVDGSIRQVIPGQGDPRAGSADLN